MRSRAELAVPVLFVLALCAGGPVIPSDSEESAFTQKADPSLSLGMTIKAAKPGDTIRVKAGVYREPMIVIDRPITLLGDPGAILDGGAATSIISIEADSVVIRGLTFRNVAPSHIEDRAAIRVGSVSGCIIENNVISDAFFGIYLAGTEGCRIAGNVITATRASEDSSGNGIHLWTARNITVADNQVEGHRDGIYLEFVHESTVSGNQSTRNLRYGLHFMYSDDCSYTENAFAENGAGVAVMYTKRVKMTANRFEASWGGAAYGLLLKEVYDAELVGNRFTRNTAGLVADGATRLSARGNVFERNGWGLRLLASTQDAGFSDNVFSGNTFDVATNSRQSTATFTGNFWDEYRGYDLDRDGRGDVPHHPVRLFSLIVSANEPSLVLMRSPIQAVLDAAERVFPTLTPGALADAAPRMRRPQ
jgi:nitrous oxidase accessory protein